MRLDFYAGEEQFCDHLAPVYLALPPAIRGDFLVHRAIRSRAEARGVTPARDVTDGHRPVLVASYGDVKRIRTMGRTRIAFLEHGAGQTYAGDPRDREAGDHASYSGGRDRADNEVFLVPGEAAAARWRGRYPTARIEAIGCPKLDVLPARVPGPGPVVAISTHFEATLCPETRSALPYYRDVLPAVAARYTTIGHGHPRALEAPPRARRTFRRAGIETVDDFEDVCRKADVYVCDNSSTLFEFAVTGRPVVVLNAPWYRREVNHGLRFWEAASVGVQVDRPDHLLAAIATALEDAPERQAARAAALDLVYAHRTGAAQRAAVILAEWLAGMK